MLRCNPNAHGRVTNKLDANGAEMFRYRYDADGRLTNRWTPAKTNTFYAYDAAGNLTKVTYPASTNITMKYDAVNRLTNMVDAVGTTAYSYTSFGAVATEDGPWASDTVRYSYDNGRRRSGLNLQAPNASDWVQSYGYDAANRLTNVTSPVGAFGYQYHPGLNAYTSPSTLVRKLTLPNGAYITNTFDDWGRLAETALKNSADSTLNHHDYAYNELNQRWWQGRTGGDGVYYDYDAFEQLTNAFAVEPGGTTNRLHEDFHYTYDLAGNLTNRIVGKLTNAFTVNNLNQLNNSTRAGALTVAGTTTSAATNVTVNTSNAILYSDFTFARTNVSLVDGNNTFTAIAKDNYGRLDTNIVTAYLPTNVTFQYDANGNLTNDGLRSFVYDDENQLTSVSIAGVFKSDFTYDGKMRRRIRREYAWQGAWRITNEVHYIYDGNLVIQERDGLNLRMIGYTLGYDLSGSLQGAGGIGGLLAYSDLKSSIANPSHYFYHADGNGNVTMLIDSNQLAAAKYLYDPFGNLFSATGPMAERNLYQFSSKEAHPASALIYYPYRFFDPNTQRWLSRDRLGDRAFQQYLKAPSSRKRIDRNLYLFVSNDPITAFDAWGLDKTPWPLNGAVCNCKENKSTVCVLVDGDYFTLPPGKCTAGGPPQLGFDDVDGVWIGDTFYKVGTGTLDACNPPNKPCTGSKSECCKWDGNPDSTQSPRGRGSHTGNTFPTGCGPVYQAPPAPPYDPP